MTRMTRIIGKEKANAEILSGSIYAVEIAADLLFSGVFQ